MHCVCTTPEERPGRTVSRRLRAQPHGYTRGFQLRLEFQHTHEGALRHPGGGLPNPKSAIQLLLCRSSAHLPHTAFGPFARAFLPISHAVRRTVAATYLAHQLPFAALSMLALASAPGVGAPSPAGTCRAACLMGRGGRRHRLVAHLKCHVAPRKKGYECKCAFGNVLCWQHIAP